MKRKVISVILALIMLFSLVACNNSKSDITTSVETTDVEPNEKNEDDYEVKAVNVYREKDVVDKTIDLHFYSDAPHVPFISVSLFYKEFFKHDLKVEITNNVYKYSGEKKEYLKFDVQENEISIYNSLVFGYHPDFQEATTKTFLHEIKNVSTTGKEMIIALNNYGIDIYGDGKEAYVPLSLLSVFSGGLDGYNIAYNGKDIYVLDSRGQLCNGEERDSAYFGDSYISVLNNVKEKRYEDLAKYTYGLLCLDFDNFRGYTSQLIMGDNNLLSLGLNGLLEKYYPDLKDSLLSLDKREYAAGIEMLSIGLFDGGHTALDDGSTAVTTPYFEEMAKKPEYHDIVYKFAQLLKASKQNSSLIVTAKKAAFTDYDETNNPFIYHFDSKTKLAYVGFDSFKVDYEAWKKYFANGMKEEDIPSQKNDTFIFVRHCFYKAIEDGAQFVILDLSTNNGGDSGALIGLVGLANKSIGYFEANQIIDRNRVTQTDGIDINLDGVYDKLDEEEAKKFTFQVGVLTSQKSFSCGNLLPSVMKEIGWKIIGQRSGGGSCAITYVSTADGFTIIHSSSFCLSNESGENIDNGVELDYRIIDPKTNEFNAELFYDYVTIANYYASLLED